ncbi:MAG: DoxX family protein [Candidatus Acidiferrales bacterium]
MSTSAHGKAVQVLRWVLGVVVLWESCLFLRRTIFEVQSSGHLGVHAWIFLVLASAEIIAAAMFLLPVVRVAGGYLLLAVFFFAAAFHILHGEFNVVGGLAIYAAAVVVCLTCGAGSREARP